MSWPHWIILPVVLPMMAGAALLLVERRSVDAARAIGLAATAAQLLLAAGLLVHASGGAIEA
ncbi:MAG: monovalent cation/H+ antiporter subunit D, partial [Gammaproteobacteria bacterium]